MNKLFLSSAFVGALAIMSVGAIAQTGGSAAGGSSSGGSAGSGSAAQAPAAATATRVPPEVPADNTTPSGNAPTSEGSTGQAGSSQSTSGQSMPGQSTTSDSGMQTGTKPHHLKSARAGNGEAEEVRETAALNALEAAGYDQIRDLKSQSGGIQATVLKAGNEVTVRVDENGTITPQS